MLEELCDLNYLVKSGFCPNDIPPEGTSSHPHVLKVSTPHMCARSARPTVSSGGGGSSLARLSHRFFFHGASQVSSQWPFCPGIHGLLPSDRLSDAHASQKWFLGCSLEVVQLVCVCVCSRFCYVLSTTLIPLSKWDHVYKVGPFWLIPLTKRTVWRLRHDFKVGVKIRLGWVGELG